MPHESQAGGKGIVEILTFLEQAISVFHRSILGRPGELGRVLGGQLDYLVDIWRPENC